MNTTNGQCQDFYGRLRSPDPDPGPPELDFQGDREDREDRVTDIALEGVNLSSPSLSVSSVPSVSSVASKEFFTMLLQQVETTPLPKEAEHLLHPHLRLLVRICVALQRNAPGQDFFLSCRSVADLLKVGHQRAATYLRVLCQQNLLKLVTKGVQPKASRYRCLLQ